MSTNSTDNTLEGVTEDAVDDNGDPDGNAPEGVTKVDDDQTIISNVIRVSAEEFKKPCRGS